MAQIVRHNPAAVHAPSSGYSMGLELSQHRRLLFISGQVPEKSDGTVPDGFEAQCEQAWRNVGLDHADGSFDAMCSWSNATEISKSHHESNRTVTTHAQVSDVIKKDYAGSARRIDRFA